MNLPPITLCSFLFELSQPWIFRTIQGFKALPHSIRWSAVSYSATSITTYKLDRSQTTNFCVRPYKARIFDFSTRRLSSVLTMLSRGMIDLLTEAGLEPALLLVLTERLPINGPGHIYLKPTSYLIAISSIGSWMMLSILIPSLYRTDWLVRPTLH